MYTCECVHVGTRGACARVPLSMCSRIYKRLGNLVPGQPLCQLVQEPRESQGHMEQGRS